MKNEKMPQILFKHLSIKTVSQLSHRLDIFENNRIFFPNYLQLNDPLEGSGYAFDAPGYAGCGIIRNADEEEKIVSDMRTKYKILSLSATCFSPSMWSHYADDFKGICIGYWTNDNFSKAQKVNYVSASKKSEVADEYGVVSNSSIEPEVFKGFFYKHTDWAYEKEYRIVKETDDTFFEYAAENVACVILGIDIDENIQKCLVDHIPENVKIYQAKIGYRSFGINLHPYGIEIKYDGSEPNYIRDVSALIDSIKAPSSCFVGST